MIDTSRMFWISAAVYAVNAAAFVLSLFLFSMKKVAAVLFLAFFVYNILMHFKLKQNGSIQIALHGSWKMISRISDLLAFVLFVHCVVVTHEGRGIEIDGVHWLRQGSEMIRRISMDEYRRLVFAETRLQIGFMLAFTARPFAVYGELRNNVGS